MREFDHNGLLLAEFQGKLFEKSEELNCSSPIFIRRFLHSTSEYPGAVRKFKLRERKIFEKLFILDGLYV